MLYTPPVTLDDTIAATSAGDVSAAAAHVLNVTGFDPSRPEPGSFVSLLLRAWMSADFDNHRVLVAAFPAYGLAMHMWRHQQHSAAVLTALADARIDEARALVDAAATPYDQQS